MKLHIPFVTLVLFGGLVAASSACAEETSPIPVGQSTGSVNCLIENDSNEVANSTMTLYDQDGAIVNQMTVMNIPVGGIGTLSTPRGMLTRGDSVWCETTNQSLGEISICDMRPTGGSANYCVTND